MSKTLFLQKRKKGTKFYTVHHFLQELGLKCPNTTSFKDKRKSRASLHCARASIFKVREPTPPEAHEVLSLLRSPEAPSLISVAVPSPMAEESTRSKVTVGLLR